MIFFLWNVSFKFCPACGNKLVSIFDSDDNITSQYMKKDPTLHNISSKNIHDNEHMGECDVIKVGYVFLQWKYGMFEFVEKMQTDVSMKPSIKPGYSPEYPTITPEDADTCTVSIQMYFR